MTDYVLTGLVKRRAELAGEIEATHDRLRKMIEDLEKLDSVILQFDPIYQVEAIRPKAINLIATKTPDVAAIVSPEIIAISTAEIGASPRPKICRHSPLVYPMVAEDPR